MCMSNNFCCRSRVCPSGSIGPECDNKLNKCKYGYVCRKGYCCADPRCPAGWIEGDSVCNLKLGEVRCPTGYECVNDFCCKKECPPGQEGGPGYVCGGSA